MTRREFIAAAPGIAGAAPAKRRNVVVILSDDHRYDFFGAAGHPWFKGKTPNMDAMVRGGIHFRNAFATTSLCSPSRASLLTGQYSFRHGVRDNSTPLNPASQTYPAVLRGNGYRTGYIGKWHMGGDTDEPRPGFDHWFSFRGQGTYDSPVMNRNGTRVKTAGYVSDILNEEAVSFLRANRDRPFLLCLSHKNVHDNFLPHPRHKGVFQNLDIPYPSTYTNSEENYRGKPHWLRNARNSWVGVDGCQGVPGGFQKLYRGYCEAVLAVDDSIGLIRRELQSLGLAEDTLLIYLGDNGYLHGEHGLIDKRCMYEPSIRIPLMMECPRCDSGKGRSVSQMVLNIDLAPTILDYAGIAAPPSMQGRSLLPMMRGENPEWRNEFLYCYFWERACPQFPTVLGFRTERYSLMQYHGIWDCNELYDVERDPEQKDNLVGLYYGGMRYGSVDNEVKDPAVKAVYADLLKRMHRELERLGGTREPNWIER